MSTRLGGTPIWKTLPGASLKSAGDIPARGAPNFGESSEDCLAVGWSGFDEYVKVLGTAGSGVHADGVGSDDQIPDSMRIEDGEQVSLIFPCCASYCHLLDERSTRTMVLSMGMESMSMPFIQ